MPISLSYLKVEFKSQARVLTSEIVSFTFYLSALPIVIVTQGDKTVAFTIKRITRRYRCAFLPRASPDGDTQEIRA